MACFPAAFSDILNKQGGAEFKIVPKTRQEDWKSFYNVDRIMFFDQIGRKQVYSVPFLIRVCRKNMYVHCL
jgi:hypothetical protein